MIDTVRLGWDIVESFMLAESIDSPRAIVVYAGRFQPFHAGHYSAYKNLVDKFGRDNVYIATSNVGNEISPFSFDEKQKIMHNMFNIPKDKIVQVKSPYKPVEILNKLPENTPFITAVSSKDANRLGGKYFSPYKSGEKLEPYKEKGYTVVVPELKLDINGKNISGTAIRDMFKNPNMSLDAKKGLFKKIYGKYNPAIFDMVNQRLSGKTDTSTQSISLDNRKITNPETDRKILVKTALSYPMEHPAHMLANKLIRSYNADVKEEVKMISRLAFLNEGGAAGHMSHPFEDMNLTFGDLKQIVNMGLEGHLNVEAEVTEKLDGQNIMVSYRDDKGVIFARNKSQVSHFGASALSVSGIEAMFAGRGDLSKAFSLAAKDLESAINSLSKDQKERIFNNGSHFISVEILYPDTTNVIPYGQNMLVLHGSIEFDGNGNEIGYDKQVAGVLAQAIKSINKDVQNIFQIRGPVLVNLPKSKDFSKRKTYYLSKISSLEKEFNLSDSSPVVKYHEEWWSRFIDNAGNRYKYPIPNNVKMGLLKRWAYDDKSYGIRNLEQDIGKLPTQNKKTNHIDFLNWAKDFDKTDKQRQQKENLKPFELLFLQLGAEILSNATGLLSVIPNADGIRRELDAASKRIGNSSDPKNIEKLSSQLEKLNSIGLDKIIPSEGIVFSYKGKVYKLTGTFASINQILGIVKYGK